MRFFFQMNTIGVILKNVLANPSFIMPVNGSPTFEAQKSASNHYKSNPHSSSWGLIKKDVFV